MGIAVRTARPDDPVAELLFLSAAPYYAAFMGSAARARRLLAGLYPRPRHTASYEVCRVAVEEDGDGVLGVLAAFPSDDGDELARRFVRLTLARTPPWRLPALLRHLNATAVISPGPPRGVLYVDALATHPDHRRRGVARRLLEEADHLAERAGLAGVALDTGIENRAARALYEHAGFAGRGLRPAPDERTARALGGSGFIGYLKPR
jgi:ribosomal protein S18 acetylase RimI-like enzyme